MAVHDIIAELNWRGLIHQTTETQEVLSKKLSNAKITVYCGFDPSSDSLHIGNLLGLINLRRFQKAGHRPIAVAGGATGFVGDPSGKSEERQLLTAERLAANLASIRSEIARILQFDADNPQGAQILNNADWLQPMSYIAFLRDIGKHFTINQMIAKESVRARLEDRAQGISYTEFSYMMLQAYDYYYLWDKFDCNLQVGGSDQWGNIVSGIELIRRMQFQRTGGNEQAQSDVRAWGLTWPLITRSDGKKFGKSEGGAIYLSPHRTNPYNFYQYFMNVPDVDVIRLLKYFTELTQPEIEELEQRQMREPEKREAQRVLAGSVTELVHGQDERIKAEQTTRALFSGDRHAFSEAALLEIAKEAPGSALAADRLAQPLSLIDLMVESGLWPSRGEAKRAIKSGGVYLNQEKVTELELALSSENLLYGKYLLLRKGKKDYYLFTLTHSN